LHISQLAPRRDEFCLLRIELGLEFWSKGDERFCFRKSRFELPNVSCIVGAFCFEDAYFCTVFLEFLLMIMSRQLE
jgi:hypothetical protein